MGKGGGDVDPKISAQEQELARIANEQAERWWSKGAPAQLEWIKQGLVTDNDRNLMAGEINSAFNRQSAGALEAIKTGLNRQGIDPTSGNFTSAMTDLTMTGGRGLSNAQTTGEVAMDNKHLGHLQNATAVLRGEEGAAQDSMATLAKIATDDSVSDAWNKVSKQNARQDMWGGIAGGLTALGVNKLKKED